MSPNFSLSPTPSTWNIPDSTGVTPKPTLFPLYQQDKGLLRRDTTVGKNTCGWINGDPSQPFTCSSSDTCVADTQYTAFGCCDGTGDCSFTTVCVDHNPGICFSSQPGDCFHNEYTVGCWGSWGCITYVMPGGIPFSSADCSDNPGTIDIQTTYAGGPANQQVPMPYTDYLIAITSASILSSSPSSSSAAAAAASSTINSESSSSDTPGSDWVSNHEALLIGVIAAVVALLLICCCSCAYFRRKKYTRARPAPAPPVVPPPHYQHSPQQGMHWQEHYPMNQYQYGPNK